MSPRPTLFLSPTSDAALSHLLEGVEQAKKDQPLRPVTLLLPSSRAIQGVRSRMGQSMGVHLHQFYSLGQAVLDAAGIATTWIGDITVYKLVQRLLSEMQEQGELSSFTAVWEKPGFIQVLVDWLREMKSQGIFPEDFAAHPLGTNPERDRQLAQLYLRYQVFLQQGGFSDADGLLWQAAEALERNDHLYSEPGRLMVFGFDQFNPVQVRILRALSGRYSPLEIYLTWDAGRPRSSLALRRLERCRQELETMLDPEVKNLEEVDECAPVLGLLRRKLFEPRAAAAELVDISPVKLVAAPVREAEVRFALRKVKQLLLDGAAVEQIALLTPQPETYLRLVETAAEEYSVPLHLSQRLENQPVIAAITNLLKLPPAFSWRGVMDALRSPFIHQAWLTTDQVDLLDQLSRERPVVGGREQWQYALHPLTVKPPGMADDEDLGVAPLVSQLEPQELAEIETGLLKFFDQLTPPDEESLRGYVLWLQEAILGLRETASDEAEGPVDSLPSLDIAGCCKDSPATQMELQALGVLMGALRGLVEAADLASPDGDEAVPWDDFLGDLLSLLPRLEMPQDRRRPGVHFGALESGRALAVDHLYVLGLAEGEFPQSPATDALYAASERENHPLGLRRYQPGEDASLFWQVICNARCSLTLLRPYLDENGAKWLPSPYWKEVQQAAGLGEDTEERIPIARSPGVEQAASTAEFLSALAEANATRVPEALLPAWKRAKAASEVQRQRQSWQPVPRFEGKFEDARLIEELTRRYGPDYVWSTSRLNRYGTCPYGFFAQTVLKLEERPDPEEGLDPMQRGSLLHAILEALYHDLAVRKLELAPDNQPMILDLLQATCDRLFEAAAQRYGFRPGPLWAQEQEELRRQLRALIRWECARGEEELRFQPHRQELRFGLPGSDLPVLKLGERGLRLHGVIDRMDRRSDGALRVVDYKSGSTKYSKNDIQKGLAFQAPLYALAGEQLLGQPVVESTYLSIPLREMSGKLDLKLGAAQDTLVQAVVGLAEEFVQRIRQGDFPSLPAKPAFGRNTCSASCEFASLCRVDRHTRMKATYPRPLPEGRGETYPGVGGVGSANSANSANSPLPALRRAEGRGEI